jgi:Zn-dependent protease
MSDAPSVPARSQGRPGVSPIFLVLLGAFGASGYLLMNGQGGSVGVFIFVLVGWVISLCLHEFGHAATAYAGGDRSVAQKGYLTLNPFRYANPVLSILLPLAFLAMGGIGFPGGAVYVNTAAIRTPLWRAAMSIAGPTMNLLCLLVIAVALQLGPPSPGLSAALAFLALLQATALVLNLLPIPGLDGFGVISPFLPTPLRAAGARAGGLVGLALLALIVVNPQLLNPLWRAAAALCAALGVDQQHIFNGYALFRFWDTGLRGELAG